MFAGPPSYRALSYAPLCLQVVPGTNSSPPCTAPLYLQAGPLSPDITTVATTCVYKGRPICQRLQPNLPHETENGVPRYFNFRNHSFLSHLSVFWNTSSSVIRRAIPYKHRKIMEMLSKLIKVCGKCGKWGAGRSTGSTSSRTALGYRPPWLPPPLVTTPQPPSPIVTLPLSYPSP